MIIKLEMTADELAETMMDECALKYKIADILDNSIHLPGYDVEISVSGSNMPSNAVITSLQQMVDMMDSGDEHGEGSAWHCEAKAALTGNSPVGLSEQDKLDAGSTHAVDYTFDGAGPYAYACHEPGHYENGMKGVIVLG